MKAKLLRALCALLLLPGTGVVFAQAPPPQAVPPQAAPQEQPEAKIPKDQLDSLVAPIALYPDPLLAQVLAASTYPLEIIQLQQWLQQHTDLKDKALADAVMQQDWDPSVQGLSAMPDVIKRLADDIKWTTDLGNAFLAQQSDVMDAVQRMRAKAQGTGALATTEQQKVETKVVEGKSVIVIEQANPEVIYVPSYNPTVVYGAPVYPYPSIYYPPPGAMFATAAISFGVGMMMGAAWGGCGWGNNDVDININNDFNRGDRQRGEGNRQGGAGNRPGGGAGNSWKHNPQHRGGAPYSNRATAKQYGGATRGEHAAARQTAARQTPARQAEARQKAGSRQQAGTMDRGGASSRQQPSAANRGGSDRIGNRDVSSRGSSRDSGAFGGDSGGYSGSRARDSSSRGSSSMGSRGGGGFGGGGGGRGGGGRGGGGGRRR